MIENPWLGEVARYIRMEASLLARIVNAIAMSDVWVAGVMSDERWRKMCDEGIEPEDSDHLTWQTGLRMISSSPEHWQSMDTALFHHAPLIYPDGNQRIAMLVSDGAKLAVDKNTAQLQVWTAKDNIVPNRFQPIWVETKKQDEDSVYGLALITLLGCVSTGVV